MSRKHPIISITGSSGAGTSTVKDTFKRIFEREKVTASFIEGDAFHKYDRDAMRKKIEEATAHGVDFTHFHEDANELEILQDVFREYGQAGKSRLRHYIHNEEEAALYNGKPGTITEWEKFGGSDLLFYEGLHGCVMTDKVNLVEHADLKIGVVPVINLEWIQKIHRDKSARGYSTEAVTDTILRRMPDYVKYICPQFSQTDINFQRVPMVDTSNPFVARWIPTLSESVLVVRFAHPGGIDFPYLLSMMDGSWMSRANSIVVPGDKLELAMQLIFTPLVNKLVERKRRLS
jgi:phosphoribulokinase